MWHSRLWLGYRNSRATKKIRFSQNYPLLRDSHFRRHSLGNKRFDHIAFLHVIEVADPDAALHYVANFAGVVFEPFERGDFSFVNLNAVTQQANIGIALDASATIAFVLAP